jgi:hypothetical protein
MARAKKTITIPEQKIINKIYWIRGKKVMLDFDLSEMYGVETKQLKRQVKRNMERFPKDFMFELTNKEFENLRCQIGTSSWGGSRYTPMAFTEQGVAMISGVLYSKTAIEVHIQIVRVFIKMKEVLLTNKNLFIKLQRIEAKVANQDGRIEKHEEKILAIFVALKKLLNPPPAPRRKIGFRRSDEKDQ